VWVKRSFREGPSLLLKKRLGRRRVEPSCSSKDVWPAIRPLGDVNQKRGSRRKHGQGKTGRREKVGGQRRGAKSVQRGIADTWGGGGDAQEQNLAEKKKKCSFLGGAILRPRRKGDTSRKETKSVQHKRRRDTGKLNVRPPGRREFARPTTTPLRGGGDQSPHTGNQGKTKVHFKERQKTNTQVDSPYQ